MAWVRHHDRYEDQKNSRARRNQRRGITTMRGSCHCGKIACRLDAEPTEAIECNCSICRRKGMVLAAFPESSSTSRPRAVTSPSTPSASTSSATSSARAAAARRSPRARALMARRWSPSTSAAPTIRSVGGQDRPVRRRQPVARKRRAIRPRDPTVCRRSAHSCGSTVGADRPPLISTAANAKGLEAWFATWRGTLGIRGLNITAGAETAFCHSLNQLSGTTTDGEKDDVWFRQTLCFRKIRNDGGSAHQHESVPFYMDGSYRAAVDLKP